MARKLGAKNWTATDKVYLVALVNSGGLEAAYGQFPGRDERAVRNMAYKLGVVFGRPAKYRQPKPVTAPVAKVSPFKVGPCDRGDREHIRRQLEHLIMRCALDLKRTPVHVRHALVEMAKTRFRADELARLTVHPDDAYNPTRRDLAGDRGLI